MLRMFAEHQLRPVQPLDGVWTLTTPDGQALPAAVPGTWEMIPRLAAYRGRARYTRTLTCPEGGRLLLRFGGVSHTADVYLDGQPIGHHYDAFTGFDCGPIPVSAGEHTLAVEVDNSFGEQSTLHIPNDYFSYGGITRPVEAHLVGDMYLGRAAFTSDCAEDGVWQAEVAVTVRAAADTTEAAVRVALAGQTAEVALPAMRAGESRTVSLCLRCPGVQPWKLLDAHLYELRCELLARGEAVDDLIDRVGFRTVRVEGESILLNGEKVFIKGFNRHEDFGSLGCAVPVTAMMQDLHLMLDMGANSVRTCHYPNDSRFLDLCDELGVLVWEECHSRAIPGEIMRKPLFLEQIDASATEMVTQHYNHPCIYTWGLLNECESDTEVGRGIYGHVIALLHSLDARRPVTFASCKFFTDVCLDLVDIASFNIYPQWYTTEEPGDYADRLMAWMDENGAAGKPILFSEFGAGGIYGYHDPLAMPKWSEERQAKILGDELRAFGERARLSGLYIWQFADVPVAEEWALIRPKAQNNKGVVDLYRRPKLAYSIVKACYTGMNR